MFLHRNMLSAILSHIKPARQAIQTLWAVLWMPFLWFSQFALYCTLVPFPQLRRNECFMFNCFVVSGTSGGQGRADGSSHGFCFKDSLLIWRYVVLRPGPKAQNGRLLVCLKVDGFPINLLNLKTC